ncbi:MAG: HAD-IIB family hydrolase [Rhodocyclaceae bacterium]|nr:HAD-IIB family hydrolase [Rhodocyclaceae bacterium]
MNSSDGKTGLNILLISVHGLIRGHDIELGCDADTGGQITYVLDLARALGRDPRVERVELLTRLIEDSNLSPDYAQAEEPVDEKVAILRLPCGPTRYLRKEQLWPHLDQMVDRCLHLLRRRGRLPDLIHSHYADAGYVGRQLSLLLGIPQFHTGHSLGRPKRARLLASGRRAEAIDRSFNFIQRIDAEEDVLAHATCIVTSTRQEIDEQYGLYRNCELQRFVVIPPGTNTERFSAPGRRRLSKRLLENIDRFLSEPGKPIILTIARPDLRKNLSGLIAAYGSDVALRAKANLVIVAGSRTDVRQMEDSQRKVLQDILLDIDLHDLWGRVALPKEVTQDDVPDLYRLATRRRGVFVNSALTEPFGLTLIEAAASGLPVIAPDDGGPRDILTNCRNGLIVDTLSPPAMAAAMHEALDDRQRWSKWSSNGITGVQRHYSWPAHVDRYLREVRNALHRNRKDNRRQQLVFGTVAGGGALPLARNLLITDIDNTLLGDPQGLRELVAWLRSNRQRVGFGVATGRTLESTLAILRKWHVPVPDVMITAVGSEIYYGHSCVPDTRWSAHIRHRWRREELRLALTGVPGLKLQAEENQREFKLSYNVDPVRLGNIDEIRRMLTRQGLQAQFIYSHGEFLDILPTRASKGHAVRHLAYRWGLPLDRFLVAGDSGNDREMLTGDTLGVVVGNHSAELAPLRGREQVFFASQRCARGILEGIAFYGFGEANSPTNASSLITP